MLFPPFGLALVHTSFLRTMILSLSCPLSCPHQTETCMRLASLCHSPFLLCFMPLSEAPSCSAYQRSPQLECAGIGLTFRAQFSHHLHRVGSQMPSSAAHVRSLQHDPVGWSQAVEADRPAHTPAVFPPALAQIHGHDDTRPQGGRGI